MPPSPTDPLPRPGWNVRLHPEALSPDPTYGCEAPSGDGIDYRRCEQPWRLLSCEPPQATASAWAARLDGARDPGDLVLQPRSDGRVELIVDFGTELEAELELELSLTARTSMLSLCGECPEEAAGDIYGAHPRPECYAHFPGPGRHAWRRHAVGLRYVKLAFFDVQDRLVVHAIRADAHYVFRERPGDFRCDDARLQRAWQTSVYTARLCTRPDTFWDGIKRDRGGWFGDARIIKEAVDGVYHDPRPSRQMLGTLPTAEWVNGVPIYSFDAIAMLRQHILAYGLGEACVPDAFARVQDFLEWVAAEQLDGAGFIRRDPTLRYFKDIGFLDWSRMPVGGRFEELSWLQLKHVAGLRDAAVIARWLGHADCAERWTRRADRIRDAIKGTFWRNGVGFLHTLNHVGQVENPHTPGWGGHYQRTYVDGIRLGPSGPSRQANALAVSAGVADAEMRATIRRAVLDNPAVEQVITAYFLYYEQQARAACGDPAGAVRTMTDYVADMLEDRDAATLIEMYDPRVRDFRRLCNHFSVTHTWPLSYCHGWGAGLVPLAQRHLMGLQATAPGWASLRLDPAADLRLPFRATVPTPRGPIHIARDAADAPLRYQVPEAIQVDGPIPDGVQVESHLGL